MQVGPSRRGTAGQGVEAARRHQVEDAARHRGRPVDRALPSRSRRAPAASARPRAPRPRHRYPKRRRSRRRPAARPTPAPACRGATARGRSPRRAPPRIHRRRRRRRSRRRRRPWRSIARRSPARSVAPPGAGGVAPRHPEAPAYARAGSSTGATAGIDAPEAARARALLGIAPGGEVDQTVGHRRGGDERVACRRPPATAPPSTFHSSFPSSGANE